MDLQEQTIWKCGHCEKQSKVGCLSEKWVLLKYHFNNNRKSNREHLEGGCVGDLKKFK